MGTHEIQQIAQSLVNEMGGDPETICSGNCTIFAMRLIDKIGRGQIVSNLTAEMEEDFNGYNETYEIIQPEAHIRKPSARNYFSTSHCWVKIDGRFYDAFNPEGVKDENDLDFIQNNG